MDKCKLFLIDAMALIYRAYFAMQKNPRINTQNINTGPILGFTNALVDIIQNQKPSHIIVAFDAKEKTFRHAIYTAYKSNRLVQPEDISIAIPYIKKIISAFQIPIMVKEGYEADDILGTLAQQAAKKNIATYIMSSDKDFAQLVEDNVYLYRPAFMGKKAICLDKQAVLTQWNIKRTAQVVDILGLQGDTSDNIPGIPGIGPKTAQKLIQHFDSVENIFDNINKVQGKKLQEILKKYQEQGLMSKKLAAIYTKVPIDFCEEKSAYKGFDKESLKAIFDKLEFRMLAKRLFNNNAYYNLQTNFFINPKFPSKEVETISKNKSFQKSLVQYHLINTTQGYNLLKKKLLAQEAIVLDTETTGLNPYQASLVGIALAYKAYEAYYIPIPENKIQAQGILQYFIDVLQYKKIVKIGQNIKYDIAVLKQYAIDIKGPFFDTMIAHAFLHPENRHNLNIISEQYLNYTPISIESLLGEKKQGITMREVPIDKVKTYACEDVDITWQLYTIFKQKLYEEGYEKIFYALEMPLIPILCDIESYGVNIDGDALVELSKKFQHELDLVEKKIYGQAQTSFNIDSPKQLGHVLFEQLKLAEKPSKTKSGQYATGEKILQQLAKKYPIIQNIMQYRGLKKLKNTYVDALFKLRSKKSFRIHTTYHQANVITGRLSSSNPNLQNIPIRTSQGKSIRSCFIPSNGHVLVSADYSQIELRIMAAFAQDKIMIEAFQQEKDIHCATAKQLFEIQEDSLIDKDMRRKAKVANFGMLYGISAFGLSQQLDISTKDAKALMEVYFSTFTGINAYRQKIIDQAKKDQYVTTLMRRKHWLRDINSKNTLLRGIAERNAINTPIQGTAAEIIKIAMIHLQKWLKKNTMHTKMVMQIHDELVLDVCKEELDKVKNQVRFLMESAVSLQNVPLKVDIGIGNTWLEAH